MVTFEYRINGKLTTRDAAQRFIRKYNGTECTDGSMDLLERDAIASRNGKVTLCDGHVTVERKGLGDA